MNKRQLDAYHEDKEQYVCASREEFLDAIMYRDRIIKAQQELSFRLDSGVKAV